jgi:hypothetical protein
LHWLPTKRLRFLLSCTTHRDQEEIYLFCCPAGSTGKRAILFTRKSVLLHPAQTIQEVRDKNDNFLLELSEAAHADYLVTRDKDSLVLEKWQQTEIITPEAFLPILRDMELLD